MKTCAFYEPDHWSTDGAKITSPENLEIIRQTLEDDGPIIVEHGSIGVAARPIDLFLMRLKTLWSISRLRR